MTKHHSVLLLVLLASIPAFGQLLRDGYCSASPASCTLRAVSAENLRLVLAAASGAANIQTLAPPAYNNGTGSYTTSVTVTIAGPSGATICYTTDGTSPAATLPGTCSTGVTYTAPVVITTTGTVLKSIATEAGWNNSPETDATYTITVPPVALAQLNGVTTGSTPGDISALNGLTIGTSTGNVASWDGINFSGAISNTFGTIDLFMPLIGMTIGSKLTSTALGTGTIPSGYCSWTTTSSYLTVGASQGSLGGSVTVDGTTFPSSTSTDSFASNDANSFTTDECSFSSSNTKSSAFSYITPGPPIETDGGQMLFDEFMIENTQNYAVLQLGTGEVGPNPNFACAWNIETAPGWVTTHSFFFPIPCGQGMRFAVTLYYDGTAGTAKADIYRPSDWAHLGSIPSVPAQPANVRGMRIGNNENGISNGTTTYFQDIMEVSGSAPPYPLLPATPKTVPTWGTQNSCSNTGSVTSLSCAITPQAAGDGLLIQACTTATSGTVTLTDTQGYGFAVLDGPTNAAGWRCATFSVFGVAAATDTITMQNTAGEALLQIVDITGNPIGVDQHSGPVSVTSGNGGVYSSANLTTTHPTEVGIGFSVCSANSCYAGAGYAEIALDANYLGSAVGSWYTATGSKAANFIDRSVSSGTINEASFITVY
ncbi:MAG: chitobiase/beta-hexosaminidase C-terminal domain-containing protein [Acidobacteriota bacterium]|nr:chitobiase/beta-hexosaminidase C-terminal domain-containing protein [Acidobacteriota bacterium]